MSTEVKNEGTGTPAADGSAASGGDDLKNVKAEFNRKLGNLEQTNQQLMSQLQALSAKLAPPKPAAEAKKVSVFDDEEAYAARVVAEAEQRIDAKLQAQQADFNRKQAVIQSLVADYPELSDQSSDLAKKAVEIFNTLPEHDKNHPMAFKAAVRDAAVELDVKPKSKRQQAGQDDFSMGAGTGNGTKQGRQKGGELDPRTVEFAKLMGLDTSNPKLTEKLKSKHGRKGSYTEWG
jgi:hypothetical protein